jgi:mono/diheme cytochrome c family protein
MKQGRLLSAPAVVLAAVIACSLPERVTAGAVPFVRGDVDHDGSRAITDAIFLLNSLFLGGRAPVCRPIADSNNDGSLNVSDAVHLLGFLFLGGPEPAPLSQAEINECKGLDPEAIRRGMKVFEEPDPDGNLFACGTCHDLAPDEELTFLRPGHTLHDALRRPSYKAGRVATFLGASNVCRIDWMVTAPWQETSPDFKDLVAFLESISPADEAPPLAFEIAPPSRTGPPAGSADDGCVLFHKSCVTCHGESGAGTFLAPSLFEFEFAPDFIREKIRLSGPSLEDNPKTVYDGLVGGVMPFWSRDKLSDAQVEDLVSYLVARPVTACAPEPPPVGGKVLRRAAFITRQHGVSGFAEELDSRKIRLTDFNYDGGGIVVKAWLYKLPQSNIGAGYAIGDDLRRPTPYVNETLVLDIPEHLTSDMYDAVSIWCVTARSSFGHGELLPP